jgi:hypothetical protein
LSVPRMMTQWIAGLLAQFEPSGSDHAEFVICDHAIEAIRTIS